ncbi:MAG: isochorismate synthase [Microcoleus sp. SIO2G3]|nr:isochorismate synthase [Microcoleus sp. SIO2G3]
MKLFETLTTLFDYLYEGFTHPFRPSKDQYPATGVQPFEGDPCSKWL